MIKIDNIEAAIEKAVRKFSGFDDCVAASKKAAKNKNKGAPIAECNAAAQRAKYIEEELGGKDGKVTLAELYAAFSKEPKADSKLLAQLKYLIDNGKGEMLAFLIKDETFGREIYPRHDLSRNLPPRLKS